MPRSQIPILMFHALEEQNTPISFPPALFARALKKWHVAGWRTLSLMDAVECVSKRGAFPEKTFVLAFDDGYMSVYRHAFPVLQAYGMRATVFIAPSTEGRTGNGAVLPTLFGREMLGWREIREMQQHGVQFGAHSLTHRDLTLLDVDAIETELRGSQQRIADALGEKVTSFAYPYGKYDARVRELAKQYYDAACSDRLGLVTLNSDVWALERVEAFYLREEWAADGMTRRWFPQYVRLRNVPRALRRSLK